MRFRLGGPTHLCVTPTGDALLFLRTAHARSFIQELYEVNLKTGAEKVLLTAEQLLNGKGEEISAEGKRTKNMHLGPYQHEKRFQDFSHMLWLFLLFLLFFVHVL